MYVNGVQMKCILIGQKVPHPQVTLDRNAIILIQQSQNNDTLMCFPAICIFRGNKNKSLQYVHRK